MAYDNLTAAQKAAIQAVLTPIIRPSIGTMQQTIDLFAQVVALYDDNKSEFRQAVVALLAADMIPNAGGLAGAGQITRAELLSVIEDMRAAVTTWREGTRLSLCIRLAGINAE